MEDKVVGHKTVIDEGGNRKHLPLYESEANEILARIDAADKKRAELMPDEKSAIDMMFSAWLRLKELGWSEACYCPKDESVFKVIESGSTGIHNCIYKGEWPTGSYWIVDDGDMCPSRPVLFKPVDKCKDK